MAKHQPIYSTVEFDPDVKAAILAAKKSTGVSLKYVVNAAVRIFLKIPARKA
jgi:hypothetical protein